LHFRKNEKICVDILRKYFNIIHNYHLYKTNKGLAKNCSVDVFIKTDTAEYIGIAIEYQGRQHYAPVNWGKISDESAYDNFKKQIVSDKNKKEFCANNRIKYIEIDGRKFFGSKLEKYLQDVIVPTINQIILGEYVSNSNS